MENKPIQITDSLIAIQVPKDASEFELRQDGTWETHYITYKDSTPFLEEIDIEYFEAEEARFKNFTAQTVIQWE